MRILIVMAMLAVGGCASGGAGREVTAVVQDEEARQAATAAAQHGEGSKAALKAGVEAAVEEKDPSEPPIQAR